MGQTEGQTGFYRANTDDVHKFILFALCFGFFLSLSRSFIVTHTQKRAAIVYQRN